jgi:ATP-dependent protease ClpP protease subunit
MAREEPAALAAPPEALSRPAISLIGRVDEIMIEKLRSALADADTEGDLAIEMTTAGGDADYARRMALDVERAAAARKGRLLFYGKSQVYSAGVTVMAAVPRENRYLTPDAVLLIHCRQMEQSVQLSGPLRVSLPKVDALRQQLETGIELERKGFEQLVAGSDVSLDEILNRALHNWYLPADEALRRGLVAGVV